ncbi:hypothetical protein [Marinobacter segnicrescens]|uniref:Uncharacterized protein n=1 Tax=Marinobacter segnicrescens TaxID=430453 RepID=A0A1I0H4W5_9GAMM|nr:hypothetical protein SAMN04487962_12414 [Marinobacter segnicrescens]
MSRILRTPSVAFALATIGLVAPGSLLAQGNDDLDVTMRMVVDDAELKDRVIQELQLPEPPAGALPKNSEGRPGRTEDLREQGRELGRQISEEARGRREERSPVGRGNAPEFPPADFPGRGRTDRPTPGMQPDDRPGSGREPGGRP